MSGWDDLPEELQSVVYRFLTIPSSTADHILGAHIEEWAYKNWPHCAKMVHAGSYYDQPEYCDELAQPGSDYCPRHEEV